MDSPTEPQDEQRSLRFFISSTFRDMQQERDELVKRVFPILRRKCEQRGVAWAEVDLRWGIPDEKSAELDVLPICLAEINRCRPCFIGILGDRYGWVPDKIPDPVLNEQTWLRDHESHSITHLEILHGLLRNPDFDGHAFFYFRDPKYTQSLPTRERKVHLESASDAEIKALGRDEAQRRADSRQQKLADLKQQIRSSGLPVRENYADPADLGRLVLEDVSALIDEIYPEDQQPDPTVQETLEHQQFARSLSKVYIGRPDYYQALDEHARPCETTLMAVSGESGGGKTSLLANWMLECDRRHPDAAVVAHFVGSTGDSTSLRGLIEHVMHQLKRTCGLPGEVPSTSADLIESFRSWLISAASEQTVILVLDGLNQLEDQGDAQSLSWFPDDLPSNVRVFVSTLPGKAADAIARRNPQTLHVKPLDENERRSLINGYLASYSKALSERHVEQIVASDQTTNPLYLRTVLEELRQFGEHEKLSQQIDHYLSADSLPRLYLLVLRRFEADYEQHRPRLVADTLSAIWASRRGLSEAEIRDLLGTPDKPLPQAYWSPLYLALENLLMNRSGLLSLSHDYVRATVERRYLPNRQRQQHAHRRLADYFEKREFGKLKTRRRMGWKYVALLGIWGVLISWLTYVLVWEVEVTRGKTLIAWAHVPGTAILLGALVVVAGWMTALMGRRLKRLFSTSHPQPLSDEELSQRGIAELPWQLDAAGEHWRLHDLLRDPGCLRQLWQDDRHETIRYWRNTVEGTFDPLSRRIARTDELRRIHRDTYGGRPIDAYASLIRQPEAFLDSVPAVADSLAATDAEDASWRLLEAAAGRVKGQLHDLQRQQFRFEQAGLLNSEGLSFAAASVLDDLIEDLGDDGDVRLLVNCLVARAEIAVDHQRHEDANRWCDRVVDLCPKQGFDSQWIRTLLTRSRIQIAGDDLGAAENTIEEAQSLTARVPDLRLRLQRARVEQLLHLRLGNEQAREQARDRCEQLASSLGLGPEFSEPPGSEPAYRQLAKLRTLADRQRLSHSMDTFVRMEQVRVLVDECTFPQAAAPIARSIRIDRIGSDSLRQAWNELNSRRISLSQPPIETIGGRVLRPLLRMLLSVIFGLFTCLIIFAVFAPVESWGLNFLTFLSLLFGVPAIAILIGCVAVFCRAVHSLIRPPEFAMTRPGLFIEHWRWRGSSLTIRDFLAFLFRPINRIDCVAVLWGEIRDIRLEGQFVGGQTLVLQTEDRDIVVGNVFRVSPAKILERLRAEIQVARDAPLDTQIDHSNPLVTAVSCFMLSMLAFLLPLIGPLVMTIWLVSRSHRLRTSDHPGARRPVIKLVMAAAYFMNILAWILTAFLIVMMIVEQLGSP